MKKTFLSLLASAVLVSGFSSCKKNSEDNDCEISVASVAGTYKLISCKYVNGSTETDALNDLYDACELDDTNELRADKVFIYTDAGVVCSPSGSETGTWDISGLTLTLNSGLATIESFNCTDLVVSFIFGGQTIRETYRRQ